jgi:hypothetical protein
MPCVMIRSRAYPAEAYHILQIMLAAMTPYVILKGVESVSWESDDLDSYPS